jgi:outer membrane protein
LTTASRTIAPAAALGLSAILWLAAPGVAQPLPLTLDDAIARALEKNEDILIERAGDDAAAAVLDGAAGAYDPLLGASAGYARSVQPVNSAFSGAPEGEPAPTNERLDSSASLSRLLKTGGVVSLRAVTSRAETNGAFGLLSPAYGSQVGVEMRQPLLRDRSIDGPRRTLRVAAADRDRAAASLRREVRDVVAAVERAYWRLAALDRVVEVGEETVRLAEEQLEQTRLRIENGAAPEAEESQPRAELERRRGDLLAARELVARADSALKLLVLGDDEADAWLRPFSLLDDPRVEGDSVDLATAMERALSTRAELDGAQSLLERRRAEADFAGDRIRPSLDLVVSYDRFGLTGSANPAASSIPGLEGTVPEQFRGDWGSSFSALADGDFDDVRVGLQLGVPIGRRGARADAVVAESAERQAAAELAKVRKTIRAEVLDAAAAVETARGRIDATRAAREAAEVQLSSERDRYAAGLSTNFLVLTRQNDLAGARLSEIEALTDYRNARAELARATGSLLEERGIDVAQK